VSERQAKAPTLRALLPSRLVPEDMLSEWQGPNLPNTKNYAPPPDSMRGRMGDVLMQGIAALGGFTGLPMSGDGDRAALLGELLAAGMPLVGGIKALRGIKAFHGSPHDFDQFSSAKIGTGEGVQAYGHGLYFAEKPDVAQIYKETLGGDGVHFPGGAQKQFAFETPEGIAQDTLKGMGAGDRDMDSVYAASRRHLQDLIDRGYGFEHGGVEKNKSALKVLDQWQQQGATYGPVGRMYEVNIDADPEDFLDWDAPLSQQSEKVRQTVGGLLPAGRSADDFQAGEYLYRHLTRHDPLTGKMTPQAELSSKLGEAGIPGIKYLDGNSRSFTPPTIKDGPNGAEVYWGNDPRPVGTFPTRQEAETVAKQFDTRSRNYVVFDDRLISIVKKYGIAAALSAGAINEMQARQMQAQGYQ